MLETLIIILPLNALVFLVFFFYFRYRFNKSFNSRVILDEIREEMEDMLRQLNEASERNIMIIEGRIEDLKALIQEADKRISLLKKEEQRGDNMQKAYSGLSKKREISLSLSGRAEDKQQKELFLSDQKTKKNTNESPAQAKSAVRNKVLELYQQGETAREIAARLGMSLAEVELIISLGPGE